MCAAVGGVRLAVTGRFAEEEVGVACYHSKVGAVELLLNHLVDGPGEYVVVDMTAGADAFASGLFTRFDLTFLVCEPTVRSVGVYRQYTGYARDFGVRLAVVGNKVSDADDLDFLASRWVPTCWAGWTGSRTCGPPSVAPPADRRARTGQPLRPSRHAAAVDGGPGTRSATSGRASSSTCATRAPGRARIGRPGGPGIRPRAAAAV